MSTATLLSVTVQASEIGVHEADRYEAQRAGSSVNRLAARTLWTRYETSLATGQDPSLAGIRASLAALGMTAQPEGAPPARTDVTALLGLAPNAAGNPTLGDVEIAQVLAHRVDAPRSTRLTLTTVARLTGSARTLEEVTEVFTFEPAPWDGLDFAMLANNVNCIMCHTTVDDARRIYPESPGLAAEGPWERARVGSIDTFQFRDDPDSRIAGTLYLGGPAVDAHGEPISDWSALSLLGGDLDASGRIQEDAFGAALLEAMTPADATDPSPFENLYIDYLAQDEPIDGALPEDFPLPFRDDGGYDVATGDLTPGGAGNRVVDDNEFAATATRFSGTVGGGAIGVVPTGTRVSTAAEAADLVRGNTSALEPLTRGNVVLTGTDSAPIEIDGDVAIDGDLILSGPITGSGSLWVRGNVYVRGDLEYADAVSGADRLFGSAADGRENALGLTAGGNIVMGDPYRPGWGHGDAVDGTPAAGWNFTLEQTASFNRAEWLKTQPELPGQPERVQTGTTVRTREVLRDEVYVTREEIRELRPTGRTISVPIEESVQIGTRIEEIYETVIVTPATSYRAAVTEQVLVGTREVPVFETQVTGYRDEPEMAEVVVGYEDVERTRRVSHEPPRYEDVDVPVFEWVRPMHTNPQYAGAGYVPRYYAFGEGDPVPIMNKSGYFDPATGLWTAEEMVHGWREDELTLADPTDPTDPTLFPASGPAAVVETLEPTAGWMDAGVLRGLIQDALGDRDASEAFKVDATLYSANSIFGVVPNSASEGTNGQLRVQGALLAADLGLLGPRGTEVLFDPRGQRVLDIRDETRIELRLEAALPRP